MRLHKPRGEYGDERAGEQVARHHREPDRERERDEQLLADADHEVRRHKDGEDTEHAEGAGVATLYKEEDSL